MAINKVAGQDVGTRLRYRLSDQDGVTFKDEEINVHLSWAVQEYSTYLPRTGSLSFDTVSGVSSYAIDGTILGVIDHNYGSLGDLTLTLTDNQTIDSVFLLGQVQDDAMRFIRDEFRGRWDERTYGQVEIVNQSWLVLYPTPIDSFGITFTYAAPHLLSGNNYPTIPPTDTTLVADLLLLACLEIEADEIFRQGDFKVGQTTLMRKAPTVLSRLATLRSTIYLQLSSNSSAALLA